MYNVAKYFQKNAILIALMLSVMEFSSHEVFICNIARNLENWQWNNAIGILLQKKETIFIVNRYDIISYTFKYLRYFPLN